MLTKLKIEFIGMASLDRNLTSQANSALGGGAGAGKYQKVKISRNSLSDVIFAAEKGRRIHKRLTAPYGDDGWRLIAADTVFEYTQEMRDCKTDFSQAVLDVKNNWNVILSNEQSRLQALYNIDDYPPQHEVDKHFYFDHEMRPVPDEGHIILDIEAETLKEIKEQFLKNEEKKLEQAMYDTWMKLFKPVKTMADICGNDKKVFSSLITNLEEVIDIVPHLNLVDDQRLTDAVNEIRSNLLGVTVGQLREDKQLKQDIGQKAEKLASVMDAYMGSSQPN